MGNSSWTTGVGAGERAVKSRNGSRRRTCMDNEKNVKPPEFAPSASVRHHGGKIWNDLFSEYGRSPSQLQQTLQKKNADSRTRSVCYVSASQYRGGGVATK